MFIEHLSKCLEATQNVFCRLDTVDTHNGLLIEQEAHLLGSSFPSSALYNAALLDDRNGDGVRAYLGSTAPPENCPSTSHEVAFNFSPFQQHLCALQKIIGIILCLKAKNIISNQAMKDG